MTVEEAAMLFLTIRPWNNEPQLLLVGNFFLVFCHVVDEVNTTSLSLLYSFHLSKIAATGNQKTSVRSAVSRGLITFCHVVFLSAIIE